MPDTEADSPTADTRNLAQKARRAIQTPHELVARSSTVRRAFAGWVGLQAATGVAYAQTQAQQAGSLMCSTGIGPILGLVFGGAALVSLILFAWMFTTAFIKKGQATSEATKEARNRFKNSAWALGGFFAPAAIGLILNRLGVQMLSCIDWSSITSVGVIAVPF